MLVLRVVICHSQISEVSAMGKRFVYILVLVISILASSTVFASSTEKSVTASIPVKCKAKNIKGSFTYVLKPRENAEQTILVDRVTLKNGQSGEFKVKYTYCDTFHYTIEQASSTNSKVEDNNTVYYADVYVMESDEGVLYAEPIIYVDGNNSKKESAVFSEHREKETDKKGNETEQGQVTGQVSQEAKTGDTTPLLTYTLMLGASLLVIILVIALRKKVRS